MRICGDVKVKEQAKQEPRRGGNRAALFLWEALENMAFVSNAASLVTYFYGHMNFSLRKSATTLTNFMGTSFLLTLFGGFISDTYFSRFKTCVLMGCIGVLGYSLLTVQAHFHQLRPAPCRAGMHQMNQCEAADSNQAAMLFTGLYLVALATGGIKAALPSLGADQFDSKDPKEAAKLSSFFNWFLFSLVTGGIIGVTFVVWISSNQGWDWSFGICTVAIMFAVVFVCMGKSLYRNSVPKGSPIVRILQVFVAAIRNRNLPLPEKAEELHEIHDKEAGEQNEFLQRIDQFRFLDRAATDQRNSMSRDASTSTTQGPGAYARFKMPGPSIPVLPLLFMFICLPIYERIFVPVARKITGIPTGIRHLQRTGVGLVLSAISMAVAGVVETRRKSVAVEHNIVDSVQPLPMSVFWLGYQYSIFGLADMFTLVGLLEFFYAESPARMKTLSTAISLCSLAFGYFTSSVVVVVVEVVNRVSGGWLASNNLNRDKLNYFYWLLSVLSALNFGVYLVCSSWYKYKKVAVENSSGGDAKGKLEMERV
ncbi:hypothetical protein SLEP1_g16825 [Rubroshorea leprosula]|uniref:Uncharacterized protein n=1 Tax=Rubroshorea leprosula TaxID=152421 RepID=A0AAV5J2N2_9ROSI|nr:hypothetical protein SLEP1_g16825 [Rubroshorea leprosula]